MPGIPNNPLKYETIIADVIVPDLVRRPHVSCKEKGPAEKLGESLDKATENVKDAVDPKGPVEKAGEKVDKALGK